MGRKKVPVAQPSDAGESPSEEQQVALAVKLFEIGIPEARVEILSKCGNWEEALKLMSASERAVAQRSVDNAPQEKGPEPKEGPKIGEMVGITRNLAILQEECRKLSLRLPKNTKMASILGESHLVESVDSGGGTTVLSTVGRLPTRALLGFGDTRAPRVGETVQVIGDATVIQQECSAIGLGKYSVHKRANIADKVVEVNLIQGVVSLKSKTTCPIRALVGYTDFDETVPEEKVVEVATTAAGSQQRSPMADVVSPVSIEQPLASSPPFKKAARAPAIGAWRSEALDLSELPIPSLQPASGGASSSSLSLKVDVAAPSLAGSAWWRQAALRWPQIVEQQRRTIAADLPRTGITRPHNYALDGIKGDKTACGNSSSSGTPPSAEVAARRDSLSSSVSVGRRSIATPQRRQSEKFDAADVGDSCERIREIAISTASPNAVRTNAMAETCQICFGDCAPRQAVRLSCHHGWYCHECMRRYAEERLAVGAVQVCCPECSVPLSEHHLRKLLPTQICDRILERSLETIADLRPCPTPNCPNRVFLEDGADPVLDCEICGIEHCLLCSATPYHEGLTCEEHAKKMARKRKRTGDEDHDASLLQWMQETGTKQCPSCRMAITKQNIGNQNSQYSECHKMCCRSCLTKFCFKCLMVLTDTSTCSCSRIDHGFVNPMTGKRIVHIKDTKKFLKSKDKSKARAKTVK